MIKCSNGTCPEDKHDGCCAECPEYYECTDKCLNNPETCERAIPEKPQAEAQAETEADYYEEPPRPEFFQELTTDPIFNLLPELTPDEYRQLEINLLRDGVLDPIVVTNGWVIIDGHNRYEIARKHGLEYRVVELCETDDDAKEWIIKNQLGRRNLSDFARIKLAQAKEEEYRELAKERQGTRTDLNIPQHVAECSNRSENETRNKVAKLADVSHETVRRKKYIEDNGSPELIEAVESGEKTIGGAYNEIKKREREEQERVNAEREAELHECELCGRKAEYEYFESAPPGQCYRCFDCRRREPKRICDECDAELPESDFDDGSKVCNDCAGLTIKRFKEGFNNLVFSKYNVLWNTAKNKVIAQKLLTDAVNKLETIRRRF